MNRQDSSAPVFIGAMLKKMRSVESVQDMPQVGTYGEAYFQANAEDVTPESVPAFLHGAAVASITNQEALVRVFRAAHEALSETDSDRPENAAFAAGMQEAVSLVIELMAKHGDALIRRLSEQPLTDRDFNDIVQNFKSK